MFREFYSMFFAPGAQRPVAVILGTETRFRVSFTDNLPALQVFTNVIVNKNNKKHKGASLVPHGRVQS